jgi:catechol 2,3-dioxygenase-like lactoylglutathione lyase family enzyme
MGTKKRVGDPWMRGYEYGALLPPFSLNLIVRDPEAAVSFYEHVLGGEIHYVDVDFAAIRVGGAEVMLHADHTHDEHPWYPQLQQERRRGLGAQFRLLGIDPDEVQSRADAAEAHVVAPVSDKGHGWREVIVRDQDGYEWAVGVLIPPAKGPHRPI